MNNYKGLLVRDTFDDHGEIPSPSVAPTASPDVICYQMDTLSPVDADITYNKQICKPFEQDMPNNIYVRAKNISGATLPGKVKAFYAPLNLLYMPPKWTPIKDVSQKKTELELVDSSYRGVGSYAGVPSQAVAVNREAFVLNAVGDPDAHHCMMGLSTSPNGSFITLPTSLSGNDALWVFLRNNPEIAYHNIVIHQPFSHTNTFAVDIGNLDKKMRQFVMNINVTKGVETLKNATLLMQSTHSECTFTHKMTMDGVNVQYGCDAKIPASYEGFMNFSVIMPDYAHVDAVLHVQNYAVDINADEMTPDATLRFLADNTAKEGTLLGDFQLYLGASQNTAPVVSRRRLLAMPELIVHRQM